MADFATHGPMDSSIPAAKWEVEAHQGHAHRWGGKVDGYVRLRVLHQVMTADGKWKFEYVELSLSAGEASVLEDQLEDAAAVAEHYSPAEECDD